MDGFAIIVAGGSGQRMKSDVPKQFLLLKDQPILIHTIRKFDSNPRVHEICLVLPKEHMQVWDDLSKKASFSKKVTVVAGGKTRFHSVKNGLSAFEGRNGLIAIHDAVRPLVTEEVITRSFEKAEEKGSAITAVNPKDSIRHIDENGYSKALDRAHLRLVQTPQTFQMELIREAYNADYNEIFTDDASVFENSGKEVEMIEGDYKNIKITTPEDLKIAEVLL